MYKLEFMQLEPQTLGADFQITNEVRDFIFSEGLDLTIVLELSKKLTKIVSLNKIYLEYRLYRQKSEKCWIYG